MANLSSGEEGSTSNQDDSDFPKIDPNIDQKLQKWSMPKIKTKKVFKIPIFEYKRDYVIEKVEKDVRIQGSCTSFVIMDSNIVTQYQIYYGYLHLGLVQVAVKPLTRLRSDFPILICLRDRRHINFHDSVLAVLETNLQSGPAYFNYFPNYSVSLGDGLAKEFLALNIEVPSDKFVQGTSLISVTYRLCCKVSNSVFGAGAIRQSPVNETVMIQVNAQNASKITKKRLKHDQITFPEEWLQERYSPPPEPQRRVTTLMQGGRIIFQS